MVWSGPAPPPLGKVSCQRNSGSGERWRRDKAAVLWHVLLACVAIRQTMCGKVSEDSTICRNDAIPEKKGVDFNQRLRDCGLGMELS